MTNTIDCLLAIGPDAKQIAAELRDQGYRALTYEGNLRIALFLLMSDGPPAGLVRGPVLLDDHSVALEAAARALEIPVFEYEHHQLTQITALISNAGPVLS